MQRVYSYLHLNISTCYWLNTWSLWSWLLLKIMLVMKSSLLLSLNLISPKEPAFKEHLEHLSLNVRHVNFGTNLKWLVVFVSFSKKHLVPKREMTCFLQIHNLQFCIIQVQQKHLYMLTGEYIVVYVHNNKMANIILKWLWFV